MDGFDEGDQFDNLRINSWEDDNLEQYMNDLDKNLNENIQYEKDQYNQKLFQSFQTSACGVAQMFKDKTQPNTPWNSFQNAAGAITVLYKDSLDACKVNFDLGVNIGQQRKLKELVNWLRKKKRRVIRKDELITFLLGANPNMKTASAASGQGGTPAGNTACAQRLQQTQSNNDRRRQQQQLQQGQGQPDLSLGQLQITPTNNATNRRHNQQLEAVANGANSDLATFREALIMHNRTRENPLIPTHPQHNNHHHHHHHNHNHHSHQLHTTNPFLLQQAQQQHTNPNHNCDDLDCFFCEQIATHIEHKRSASNAMDMDSPTRKRGRFH